MGLANFWSNFVGLAVMFFSCYVHLAVSIFFRKLSPSLDYFARLRNSWCPISVVCVPQSRKLEKSKCLELAKRNASLDFLQSFTWTIQMYFVLCFFMCSYNKLEDDFQSESDPLRAYNDYLEDVENISKYYLSLLVTW